MHHLISSTAEVCGTLPRSQARAIFHPEHLLPRPAREPWAGQEPHPEGGPLFRQNRCVGVCVCVTTGVCVTQQACHNRCVYVCVSQECVCQQIVCVCGVKEGVYVSKHCVCKQKSVRVYKKVGPQTKGVYKQNVSIIQKKGASTKKLRRQRKCQHKAVSTKTKAVSQIAVSPQKNGPPMRCTFPSSFQQRVSTKNKCVFPEEVCPHHHHSVHSHKQRVSPPKGVSPLKGCHPLFFAHKVCPEKNNVYFNKSVSPKRCVNNRMCVTKKKKRLHVKTSVSV